MTTVQQLLDGKGRAIYSIAPEDPVLQAIRLMADRHVGALVVMKGQELVGIVSERDYARKVILMGRSSSDTPVWEIMTAAVMTRRRRTNRWMTACGSSRLAASVTCRSSTQAR